MSQIKKSFLHDGLLALQDDLYKLNIELIFHQKKSQEKYPTLIESVLKKQKASALFFNEQYEYYERMRDKEVVDHFKKNHIPCFHFEDQFIQSPSRVLKKDGSVYSVFTAYKNLWYKKFLELDFQLLPPPQKQKLTKKITKHSLPVLTPFKRDQKLWPAGENAGAKRLRRFVDERLDDYHLTRDFPAKNSTSRLSAYFSLGFVSPRGAFYAALIHNQNELVTGSKGAVTWMNELIWRDFYKYILYYFPRVSKDQPYKLATKKIKWRFDQKQFTAWQNGETGYPLIDAAMRQLKTEGFMHNRLRMVTAMFLVKNLFFNWQNGETHFTEELIDCDLSANNGGWQWCASTGTDSAPYFRIFNPSRQSERFDKEGEFIKKYCPELKDVPAKDIHDPEKLKTHLKAGQYFKPIIDLNLYRDKVLSTFKKL